MGLQLLKTLPARRWQSKAVAEQGGAGRARGVVTAEQDSTGGAISARRRWRSKRHKTALAEQEAQDGTGRARGARRRRRSKGEGRREERERER
ncbi:hypothetical protein U1Q18_035012 [Sarracenia purpurea var. burkii]